MKKHNYSTSSKITNPQHVNIYPDFVCSHQQFKFISVTFKDRKTIVKTHTINVLDSLSFLFTKILIFPCLVSLSQSRSEMCGES